MLKLSLYSAELHFVALKLVVIFLIPTMLRMFLQLYIIQRSTNGLTRVKCWVFGLRIPTSHQLRSSHPFITEEIVLKEVSCLGKSVRDMLRSALSEYLVELFKMEVFCFRHQSKNKVIYT